MPMQTHLPEASLSNDSPRLHQDNVSGEAQHFLELMADIDHRNGETVAQRLEIGQHLLAASAIEAGEGLIEQ